MSRKKVVDQVFKEVQILSLLLPQNHFQWKIVPNFNNGNFFKKPRKKHWPVSKLLCLLESYVLSKIRHCCESIILLIASWAILRCFPNMRKTLSFSALAWWSTAFLAKRHQSRSKYQTLSYGLNIRSNALLAEDKLWINTRNISHARESAI